MAKDDVLIGELPPALLVRDADKIPCFSLREATKFWPHHDPQFVWARLKGLAERRLIHQRQRRGAGKTSAAQYDVVDLAAAAALFALLDLGIHDAEVMTAASTGLYAWDDNINPPRAPYPMPIAAALFGALSSGEFWTLKVGSFHHDQTGDRRLLAATLPEDQPLNAAAVLPPAYLPRSSIYVVLPPLLLPFSRAFGRPGGH